MCKIIELFQKRGKLAFWKEIGPFHFQAIYYFGVDMISLSVCVLKIRTILNK